MTADVIAEVLERWECEAGSLEDARVQDGFDRTPFVGPPRVRGGGYDEEEGSAALGRTGGVGFPRGCRREGRARSASA
jgi:hypothetical protein